MTDLRLLGFFSSDSRPLYKSDIYNSLCLPHGYVIHFRYKKKYIEQSVYVGLSTSIGNVVVIYFAESQKEDKGHLNFETKNTSVREAILIDFVEDYNTDILHFYLQLGDYKEFFISNENTPEKLPPKLFVSKLKVIEGKDHKWSERIEIIKDSFKNHLFVNIEFLKKSNNTVLIPTYEPKENNSIYKLQDETEYILNISFKNSEDITKSRANKFPVLLIEDKTKQIDINVSDFVDIGTNLDSRKIRLVTKPISNINIDSFISFKIAIYDENQNKVESILQSFFITSRINKKYLNVIIFSICSMLAIAAVGLMAIFTATLKDNKENYWLFSASVFCVGISSAVLFGMFNKK